MIRKTAALAAACVVAVLPVHRAHALDAVAAEAGYGNDSTRLLRLALVDAWRKQWPVGESWRLGGYWEVDAGVWDNPERSVAEVGVTPVFRLERGDFYLEGAIGFHLVEKEVSATRKFSTTFQFGDHLGAGFYFGPGRRYDLGIRVQHLSNASIDTPNPGINFVLVRLQYRLE